MNNKDTETTHSDHILINLEFVEEKSIYRAYIRHSVGPLALLYYSRISAESDSVTNAIRALLDKLDKKFQIKFHPTIGLYLYPKSPVTIERLSEVGEWLWAIFEDDNPEYWFEAFPTKKEALDYCKYMGMEIKK